jgi:hypothetical protein
MAFKYLCTHCDYSSCTHPVVNHILEHHTDKIDDYKLKSGINGNLITMYIRSEKSNDPINIFCCFGCKKFWGRQSMAEKHKKECLKKQEHIDILKEIQKNRKTPIDACGGDKKLQDKIILLENKIRMLEDDLEEYKEAKLKYDELSMVLIYLSKRSMREEIANILCDRVPNVNWNSELVTYREGIKDIA